MAGPLIGITMDSCADRSGPTSAHFVHYSNCVQRAGGRVLAIPYRQDLDVIPGLLDQIDGILFSGGDDLDPALYGESWHPGARPIDPVRQKFELTLLAEAEKQRMPILGICLGVQLMNVHRGGSLIQFLPDHPRENPLEHRKLEAALRRHPVRIQAGSITAQAIGSTDLSANTYHKQAVNRPGQGLRVTAWAPDGIIEALEDATLPLFVGAQWHPERLPDEPEHLALFKLLVSKAGRNHR